MRLTIAYSKIKKRNLVLINNATHQRETLSERSIRPPLSIKKFHFVSQSMRQTNNIANKQAFLAMFSYRYNTDFEENVSTVI